MDTLLDNLVGRRGGGQNVLNNGGTTANVNWNRASGDPITELKTEGFFTQAFSTIFINGSCDMTIPKLKSINYDEFVTHIYQNVDNRVSQHPF